MSDARQQAERALEDADRPFDAAAEEPLEPENHPDRTRENTHTGLSRMHIDWSKLDSEEEVAIKAAAMDILKAEFHVAFVVMKRIDRRVRTPLLVIDPVTKKPTGEVQHNADGTPMWKLDEDGVPEEDWSLMDDDTRRSLLYTIIRWLHEWELKSVDKWASAMFAKVEWEEKFARGFVVMHGAQPTGRPTIQDRTQWGHLTSAEERYKAVFKTYLSKQADALVRVMIRLQRVLENTAIN